MGCVSSTDSPEAKRSRAIEKTIKQDEAKMRKQVKLLLLGAGESGKSTVLKQMKVLYNKEAFTPAERESYRQLVFSNIVQGMRLILDAAEDFNIEIEPQNREHLPILAAAPELADNQPFPPQYLTALQALWQDPGVQATYARANEAAIPEHLPYFYSDLGRFWQLDYRATDADILRCRAKSIGIVETRFRISEWDYHIFDVGGQRSERKKWIHCFEGVTAVLFLVSIGGYDQVLVEDRESNQMHEALMLFDSICNSRWFVKTSMILFLNKDDIFREKIKYSPIKNYFPDYDGPMCDYAAGRDYFKRRFVRLNRTPQKEVYVHVTNATDTALLKVVMAAVTECVPFCTIIQRNLREMLL